MSSFGGFSRVQISVDFGVMHSGSTLSLVPLRVLCSCSLCHRAVFGTEELKGGKYWFCRDEHLGPGLSQRQISTHGTLRNAILSPKGRVSHNTAAEPGSCHSCLLSGDKGGGGRCTHLTAEKINKFWGVPIICLRLNLKTGIPI